MMFQKTPHVEQQTAETWHVLKKKIANISGQMSYKETIFSHSGISTTFIYRICTIHQKHMVVELKAWFRNNK